MKCSECSYWWWEPLGDHFRCHADPRWPAPCEYEDYEEEEEE